MGQFISGSDVSIAPANRVAVATDDAHPDNEFVQQTVEMLAMYRPEGGEFLFVTPMVRQCLTETRRHREQ